ncbi:MAG: type IV pilus assembly protein PilM [bacterium]
MAKTVSSVVGVDIGTHTIKVAELRLSKDRPVLTGVGIAPTPPGAVDSVGVQDPVGLGVALKKLLSESGITTKQVVFGISGQSSVVVRILEVPRMSQAELAEHMQWEIQRNIPFADTAIVSDFRPIDRPNTPPDSQTMEVVLAVAPQDAIDRIVDVGKAANLRPIGIDVEPLALNRSLILSQYELYGDKTICVINLGASSSTVDIYQNGLLVFPRILPIGGNMLTDKIKQAFGVSAEEAESLKRDEAEVMMNLLAQQTPTMQGAGTQSFDVEDTGGFEITSSKQPDVVPTTSDVRQLYEKEDDVALPVFPGHADYVPPEEVVEATPEPVQQTTQVLSSIEQRKARLFYAISQDLEELVGEIRRSIEYFRSRSTDSRIDQILICGGSAGIRNLDEYLHQSLDIPVVVADPLRGIQVNTRRYSEEFLMQNALLLPVSIGMAMNAFYE